MATSIPPGDRLEWRESDEWPAPRRHPQAVSMFGPIVAVWHFDGRGHAFAEHMSGAAMWVTLEHVKVTPR